MVEIKSRQVKDKRQNLGIHEAFIINIYHKNQQLFFIIKQKLSGAWTSYVFHFVPQSDVHDPDQVLVLLHSSSTETEA